MQSITAAPPTENATKSKYTDAQARRAAQKAGLRAHKSRWREGTIQNRGGFQLVGDRNNFIVFIVAGEKFDLSADDVVARCRIVAVHETYLLSAIDMDEGVLVRMHCGFAGNNQKDEALKDCKEFFSAPCYRDHKVVLASYTTTQGESVLTPAGRKAWKVCADVPSRWRCSASFFTSCRARSRDARGARKRHQKEAA